MNQGSRESAPPVPRHLDVEAEIEGHRAAFDDDAPDTERSVSVPPTLRAAWCDARP
jgi:hypothetical protein